MVSACPHRRGVGEQKRLAINARAAVGKASIERVADDQIGRCVRRDAGELEHNWRREGPARPGKRYARRKSSSAALVVFAGRRLDEISANDGFAPYAAVG